MDHPTCIHDDENPGKHCREVKCDDCPFRPSNPVKLRGRVLYLDLDGVLADFDKLAHEICGMAHHKFAFVYGDDVFWRRLNGFPNFFGSLDLMPDAAILYNAVRHLKPVILTALPRDNTDRVAAEKAQWVYENVDKEAKVITCFTKDKPNYCQPGDVLIDDRAINQAMWRRRGGHFVIHTSAENSINQLINLGVL
jgi:hypothetical protein